LPRISNEAWRIGAARAHLLGYASYIDPTYKRPPHIWLLAEHLMAVEAGRIKRLIVELPPRHGKSETTTVKFPAWYLGRNTSKRVIIASHTASLAARFSMRARNDFEQFAPEIWGVSLSKDASAMYRWDIEDPDMPEGQPPGGMIAAGVGGPITGHGAHLAIIDDPVKDAEDANSETQREAKWDWYRFVLRTRLMPGGAIVLVLTRWHEDDLAGRLLKAAESDPDADQWTVLRLPAIAEDGELDPLGREPGEALWPEQYDEAALREIKSSVGSYVWAALYQQRPTPAEGGVFKRQWWKYYRVAPGRFEEVIQSWDMTYKDNKDNDFVVGQVWGRIGADKYLLDQVRERMDFPTTVQAVKNLTAKWRTAHRKLIEDKANGPAVISSLRSKISGLIAVNPQGGKEARAAAVSPDVEAGNVYLPDPTIAPWIGDFVEECAAFPGGAHDDQVDAMTQALVYFNKRPSRGDKGKISKPSGF